jgi:hypothetical protein
MVAVTVKDMHNHSHIIECEPSTTIAQLRDRARQAFNFAPDLPLKLLYAGNELHDNETIAGTNYIPDHMIVILATRHPRVPAAPPPAANPVAPLPSAPAPAANPVTPPTSAPPPAANPVAPHPSVSHPSNPARPPQAAPVAALPPSHPVRPPPAAPRASPLPSNPLIPASPSPQALPPRHPVPAGIILHDPETFDANIQQLMEMGYPEDLAYRALLWTRNSLPEAGNAIVNGSVPHEDEIARLLHRNGPRIGLEINQSIPVCSPDHALLHDAIYTGHQIIQLLLQHLEATDPELQARMSEA